MHPLLFAPADLVPVDRAATVRRLRRVPRDDNPNFPTLFGRPCPAHTKYGYFTWDGPSKSWHPRLSKPFGQDLVLAHYKKFPLPGLVLSVAARSVFAAAGRRQSVCDPDHDLHSFARVAVCRAGVSFDPARASFVTYAVWFLRKAGDLFLQEKIAADAVAPFAELTEADADPRAGRAAEIWEAAETLSTVLGRAGLADRRLLESRYGVGCDPVPVRTLAKRLRCSRQAVENRCHAALGRLAAAH